MEFNIHHNTLKKCENFAKKRIEGSSKLYSFRGELRESKIFNDIVVGALGEMLVYKHLLSLGLDCSKPDFTIYESKSKSFDADLYCGDYTVHVKSQSKESFKKYGHSWLLQKSDSLVNNPKDTDLFAFVNIDLEARKGTILGFCKCSDVVYGECRVPSYRHSKVALYLKDFLLTAPHKCLSLLD